MTLLRIDSLGKFFDGVKVVDNVSFDLDAGELLAAHRTERRGQIDVLQHDRWTTQADFGLDPFRRSRNRRQASARYLASRRRPHISDCCHVQFNDRA